MRATGRTLLSEYLLSAALVPCCVEPNGQVRSFPFPFFLVRGLSLNIPCLLVMEVIGRNRVFRSKGCSGRLFCRLCAFSSLWESR